MTLPGAGAARPEEAARTAEDQRSLKFAIRTDVAQRAIDLAEAGRRPSEPSPQELVQLHRASALGDQRDPAELDVIARREFDGAPSFVVDPKPLVLPASASAQNSPSRDATACRRETRPL